MDKDVYLLWLEALRSKVYKVSKFRMTDGFNRFSPIGVLADILIKNYGEGRWYNQDDPKFEGKTEYVYGYAWRYRPLLVITNEITGAIQTERVDFAINYNVYLPLQQWYWPSLSYKIQDIIYNWTDCQGFQHEQVADLLEDQLHLQEYR